MRKSVLFPISGRAIWAAMTLTLPTWKKSVCCGSVAPGSGTRELAGLAGQMTLRIEDGHHFYDLEYTLPAGE